MKILATVNRRSRRFVPYLVGFAIPGLGHLLVREYKRGVILLLVGFATNIALALLLPLQFALPMSFVIRVWQLYDLKGIMHESLQSHTA